MEKNRLLVVFFLLLSLPWSMSQEGGIETWWFHVEAENAPAVPQWSDDFGRAGEELQGLVELKPFDQKLHDFMTNTSPDGFYAYYVFTKSNRLLNIFYFQVSNGHKYLLSYLQEAVFGNDFGRFAYQTFRRTYPLPLTLQNNRARGNSSHGILESQSYYHEDFLLGKTRSGGRITVAYIDEEEEEVAFQETNVPDGVYRRAWIDTQGRIALKKALPLPEDIDHFSLHHYYGFSLDAPAFSKPYTLEEFQAQSLRRTMPLTIVMVHKKGFYKPLVIQMHVPFFDDLLQNVHKIMHLEQTPDFTAETKLSGSETKQLKLARINAKINIQLVDFEGKPMDAGEGAGKIEIFKEDGSRLIYRGRSSFTTSKSYEIMMDVGRYTFAFKPFFTHKYIVQQKEVMVRQDDTISFVPFKRIPYLFHEFQNSVYSSLGAEFSASGFKDHVRSLNTLTDLIDLLGAQKMDPKIWENFLNTVIEVYEKNEPEIWKEIPSDHPHHLAFHFDLIEIYWRRSMHQDALQNLEKSLKILTGEEKGLKEFCAKWFFVDGRMKDIKNFRTSFFKEKPGLLRKLHNKWDRYRFMYCLSILLLRYYQTVYQDISETTCDAFGAAVLCLSECFKMKNERSRALGEEHPGLDYNVANMLGQVLEWTMERAQNSKGWTDRQKHLLAYHLNESESKHVLYSAFSFLEALGEEFHRRERWDLQMIPEAQRKDILFNCSGERRQKLENFVNEVLRKWLPKK